MGSGVFSCKMSDGPPRITFTPLTQPRNFRTAQNLAQFLFTKEFGRDLFQVRLGERFNSALVLSLLLAL